MPRLDEMLRVEDNRAHIAVKRAIDQISYALKDYGLMVEVDPEGNFSAGKLPADFPIKGERISDNFRRQIHESRKRGKKPSGLRLTHEGALLFAEELVEYQMYPPAQSSRQLYDGLVAGGFRFLDVPVEVIG